jgi:Holliday junction resolvase RusA-like endonuclease
MLGGDSAAGGSALTVGGIAGGTTAMLTTFRSDMTRYPITPLGKPRQTQRDRWAKRPAVLRYRAFCDEVRARGVQLPESGCHVLFVLPMPRSWSRQKREIWKGKPHQQKPDLDNCVKALLDALYADDCRVWDMRCSKVWGDSGEIVIRDTQAAQAG